VRCSTEWPVHHKIYQSCRFKRLLCRPWWLQSLFHWMYIGCNYFTDFTILNIWYMSPWGPSSVWTGQYMIASFLATLVTIAR
jgi:hypothetical protein